MEQLLFAFSNLIGAKSQKSLYDWNNYHTNDNSDSGTPVESPATRRSASKEPSFNKADYQPAMRQRSTNNRSPVRGAYSSQNSQEYQNPNPVLPQKGTIIKTQSREMNIVEEKKSVPQVETRNMEPEQPVQHQISPKSEVEESKPVQENEVERSSSPSQQEKERRSPPKENQQARGRTSGLNLNQVEKNSDHMVEIQSLDLPSKSTPDEAKNVTALSSRQLQSFRRSSASRQKVGGLPTSVSVARIENVNSVPVRIDHETKVTKNSLNDDATIETRKPDANNYMSKSDPVSSLSRKSHPKRDEGYAFSPSEEKRVEEVIDGEVPLSYLDIMKLKKKEKSNSNYQPEIHSSKYEVQKQQVNVGEDWDNDLFGDGKLSPVKTAKKLESNYNSQYLTQPNQSSAQISKLTGGATGRKIETAIGKTETFAVRGYVHNDWDDDL